MSDRLQHSERRLPSPERWVLYLSHNEPQRLVVFVHGFGGKAVNTWQRFPNAGPDRAWWTASDMLFVGYDSKRATIPGTAARLRREISHFYPQLPDELLCAGGCRIRARAAAPYGELCLVGHSLGGLIVRRALCDAAKEWSDERRTDPNATRPVLLEASVRLFSPASAGFRAAGFLGLMRASPVWGAVEMWLRRSSAYTDLQPGSDMLVATREWTLQFADDPEFRALRARILWAEPDDVVVPQRYPTDHVDQFEDGKDHSAVCKPRDDYGTPWAFVETGRRS